MSARPEVEWLDPSFAVFSALAALLLITLPSLILNSALPVLPVLPSLCCLSLFFPRNPLVGGMPVARPFSLVAWVALCFPEPLLVAVAAAAALAAGLARAKAVVETSPEWGPLALAGVTALLCFGSWASVAALLLDLLTAALLYVVIGARASARGRAPAEGLGLLSGVAPPARSPTTDSRASAPPERLAEVLAEVRALHRRLDSLEVALDPIAVAEELRPVLARAVAQLKRSGGAPGAPRGEPRGQLLFELGRVFAQVGLLEEIPRSRRAFEYHRELLGEALRFIGIARPVPERLVRAVGEARYPEYEKLQAASAAVLGVVATIAEGPP